MNSITVVTAFFDIGRGEISTDQYPSYLKRTTDTYFEYFANLAQLDNEMVIFSEPVFKDQILNIRKGKPTTVITLDIFDEFSEILNTIKHIQLDPSFQAKIPSDTRQNIEYWNEKYVLLTNLKTYFVTQAIKHNKIDSSYVAWVDFGYVRSPDVLNKVQKWDYNFSKDKVNFFSIKKHHALNCETDVHHVIFHNEVFIIGGVVVASPIVWKEFKILVKQEQCKLLNNRIIDDDQGVFMMCLYKNPDLFHINFLGKNQWFSLFRKFDKTSKISIFEKIKDYFGV